MTLKYDPAFAGFFLFFHNQTVLTMKKVIYYLTYIATGLQFYVVFFPTTETILRFALLLGAAMFLHVIIKGFLEKIHKKNILLAVHLVVTGIGLIPVYAFFTLKFTILSSILNLIMFLMVLLMQKK